MLTRTTATLIFLVAMAANAAVAPRTVHVLPPELEAAVDSVLVADGELCDIMFKLAPGTHRLRPVPYTDPTCGNCQEAATPVPATLGLRVSGRNVAIIGAGTAATFLRANADYGLLFEDCEDCRLSDLTLTGGVRDDDGRATDAAVVVRQSSVTLERCRIADNLGAADLLRRNIVGIMGTCGREGARLTVAECDVVRNSWDGGRCVGNLIAVSAASIYRLHVDDADGLWIGGDYLGHGETTVPEIAMPASARLPRPARLRASVEPVPAYVVPEGALRFSFRTGTLGEFTIFRLKAAPHLVLIGMILGTLGLVVGAIGRARLRT